MNRLLALAVAVAASLTIGSAPATATRVIPHTASCANTFPADGHPGPWRTSNNGGTLHGNTVHIQCPSSSTHWDVTYRVQLVGGPPCPCDIFTVHRSGNGTPADWSASTSPYPCQNPFAFRTHVDNNVTGGNANKPTGGGGVHIGC